MLPASSGESSFQIVLANEQATHRLAMDVAAMLMPGDIVTLSGDLGAGKTTFARALIRHLAGDERLDVPSPTFTLVQTYALPRFPLVHGDLYRVWNRASSSSWASRTPARAPPCFSSGRTGRPTCCPATGSTSRSASPPRSD